MRFSNNLAHDAVTVAVSRYGPPVAPEGGAPRDVLDVAKPQLDTQPAGLASEPTSLAALAEDLAARRQDGLSPAEEDIRQAARNMLRFGRFKPTGRSKPASEYLLGVAARGETLPSVLPVVDIANILSLSCLLPISIWDPRRMPGDDVVFRTGLPGESYVFNSANHEIDLEDLVCGCAVAANGNTIPIVNPVKDSMTTKLALDSSDAVMAIYLPRHHAASREVVARTLEVARRLFPRFAGLHLLGSALLDPGQSAVL